MFLYHLNSPQDWHIGMVDFLDFMSSDADREDKEEVMKLAIRAFFTASKVVGGSWEGDVRSGEFKIFAVPGEISSKVGILWKQQNNGCTFVFSPVVMPWLDAELFIMPDKG